MTVALYDASALGKESDTRVPLAQLPSVSVEVEAGWSVQDVVRAGGGYGFNSLALVTSAVEADVGAGEKNTISAPFNLLGVRGDGRAYFQDADPVRWDDFERAARSGLYEGDASRVVFYPYGTAGGSFFEVVGDLVQWLADASAVVGGVVSARAGRDSFSEARRRKIGEDWRRHGVVPGKLRLYIQERVVHDPAVFGPLFGLSALEAVVVLRHLDLDEGDDGLWRHQDQDDARR